MRKVFRLGPGETYKGRILLAAGAKVAGRSGDVQHGSFEDRATRNRHVLGRDARKYTVELRYQINPKSHGVMETPPGYRRELLWTGEMTTGPLTFEVNGR